MLLTKVPVLDLIADLGGIRAIEIVRCLDGMNEVAENELATRLNMDMHVVRGTLQRLYESRLVRFRKERGQDGWWIYFWSLDLPRLVELVDKTRRRTIHLLKQKLTFERENHFFRCTKGCLREAFDLAFEHDFLCPCCGMPLVQMDNAFHVEEIHSYINTLESLPISC